VVACWCLRVPHRSEGNILVMMSTSDGRVHARGSVGNVLSVLFLSASLFKGKHAGCPQVSPKRLGAKLDVKQQFGPVVVYAPNATKGQQSDLARRGAIWVGDLFGLLDKLRELKEDVHSRIKVPKNPKKKGDPELE